MSLFETKIREFGLPAVEGAEIDSEDEPDGFSIIFSFVYQTGCLEDLTLDHTAGTGDGGGMVWFPLCPSGATVTTSVGQNNNISTREL